MTAPSVDPSGTSPGWYTDPWSVAAWRWWDGYAWTAHVSDGTADQAKRPRLPAWLSTPVLIASILTVPIVIGLAIVQPVAVLLGLVPLVIVLPPLAWLDRVEPEPWSSRLHALLWGATVAGIISVIINTITAIVVNESVAAVISAPVVEEATKGLGVLWAVRRREVDSVMDGIVYAGWVALGFAVIEDFNYFASAGDLIVQVFITRALLTPFAHPLFTAWIGLAIGLAISRRQSIWAHAFWGYGLAVVSHAAWNGSLVYAEESGNATSIIVAATCFVILFVLAVVTVVAIRRNEQRNFLRAVPVLARRYGMAPSEIQVFGHWRTMLATRRSLPRHQRRQFDAVHSALARLAQLHQRPGPIEPVAEQRLVDQLQRARATTA
ncbi:MAG: PrsW family glutamic-type intramembrane protease [Actinomycetota bacterium]